METSDDLQLWNELRKGNKKALDLIFEKHIRLLYNYSYKFTKDFTLAEDCIQDLFVELWVKREVLSEVNCIKFYLFKSLRRRILRGLKNDHRLNDKREISEEYHFEVALSCEMAIVKDEYSAEQNMKLQNALSALSDRQKEIIHLKFFEELSYEEIASIMSLTVQSVYNLLSRTVSQLRESISHKSTKSRIKHLYNFLFF